MPWLPVLAVQRIFARNRKSVRLRRQVVGVQASPSPIHTLLFTSLTPVTFPLPSQACSFISMPIPSPSPTRIDDNTLTLTPHEGRSTPYRWSNFFGNLTRSPTWPVSMFRLSCLSNMLNYYICNMYC